MKKILLVDDDPAILDSLPDVLKDKFLTECTFTTAENGNAAIEEIAKLVPDLVITDLGMPGDTNGIQLTEFIKTHYPDLPVILGSGYAEVGKHLADTFITKPYDLTKLAEAIRHYLPS